MAGKFTNYTLQENVAWSSLLEKLRNHTHLSFRNRKRKDHSNTKPLLLFIKSEKPKITLSYLKKKHCKFQSKPKYSLHHCKTEMPHHAYHRSVHISKQEQDESMFLVLTLVMFFGLSCDKDTFSVHDIPLIRETAIFCVFWSRIWQSCAWCIHNALYFWTWKLFFFSFENNF